MDDDETAAVVSQLVMYCADRDGLPIVDDGERRAAVAQAVRYRDDAARVRIRAELARLLTAVDDELERLSPAAHGFCNEDFHELFRFALATPWPPPEPAPVRTPPRRDLRTSPFPRRCPSCGGMLDRQRTTAVEPALVEVLCHRCHFFDSWTDLDESEPRWLAIPGGRYTIGLDASEVTRLVALRADEKDDDQLHGLRRPTLAAAALAQPAFQVVLDPFEIQSWPVTRDEYAMFAAATGAPLPDGPEYAAVRGVSWDAAARYAAWIGGALPTEAQWERFARGPDRHLFAVALDAGGPSEWCRDRFAPYPGADPARWRRMPGGMHARRGGIDLGDPPCPALRSGGTPEQTVGMGFRCVRG